VAHFEAALRYADDHPAAELARLRDGLVYEYYLTGAYQQALQAQQSALETWRALGEPVKVGDGLTWLSRLHWCLGNGAEASQYCHAAITILESQTPGPELALAYSNQSDLAMESHEIELAIESAQRAIALAEALGDDDILCGALNTLGTTRLIVGDTGGWADLNRSLQVSLAGGLQREVASAYTNLLAMAVSRRQYEQAAAYLHAGLSYCEERDLDFTLPYMLAYGARMKFERGDWNAASTDVETVLRHPHTAPVTRIPALRTLAHLRVRRGDPDANGPIEEARSLAGPAPELQRAGMLALVCAEAAWLADDPGRSGPPDRVDLGARPPQARPAHERRAGRLAVESGRPRAAAAGRYRRALRTRDLRRLARRCRCLENAGLPL
jgi:tetratricopeptide (TPR) repeat protein